MPIIFFSFHAQFVFLKSLVLTPVTFLGELLIVYVPYLYSNKDDFKKKFTKNIIKKFRVKKVDNREQYTYDGERRVSGLRREPAVSVEDLISVYPTKNYIPTLS